MATQEVEAPGAPKPTPAAGRARRLVYMALEDYYEEDRKAYKPGHSDASIAKDCGVSEACVKQIREESYGPLAVPVDLSGVLAEVRKLKREAEAAHKTEMEAIEACEERIDALIAKNGWQKP